MFRNRKHTPTGHLLKNVGGMVWLYLCAFLHLIEAELCSNLQKVLIAGRANLEETFYLVDTQSFSSLKVLEQSPEKAPTNLSVALRELCV